MRGGFIAISRAAWDHYVFKDEPMSMREAWFWMLAQAAWKPTKIRTSHGIVPLERGQFTHSLRHMAKTFGWSVNRVRRVLDRYSDEHMLVLESATATNTAQLIVTICNYDKYQGSETAPDTAPDTGADTRPGTQTGTRKNKRTNNQSSNEDIDTAFALFRDAVKSAVIPTPHALTPDRRRSLKARLGEHGLENWQTACTKLATSDFCNGRNDKQWVADIEFLLSPKKFVKVLEGSFDNKATQSTGPPQGRNPTAELDAALFGDTSPIIEAIPNE